MVEKFEDPTYLSNVIFLKNSKGFKVPENLSFQVIVLMDPRPRVKIHLPYRPLYPDR